MAYCQPCGFAVVLCEAPPLLATLSPQDWAALSSCNKQLRHLIHSSATVVTVNVATEAEAVMRGSWPQLALIKVKPAACVAFSLPAHGSNLELLVSINYWSESHQASAALVVSLKTEIDQHKSIASAFRHLQHLQLQDTTSLTLTVHRQGADVMAQMARCDWPCVTGLSLAHNKLGHASIIQLAKGSWPKLKRLDLIDNQLDEAAMTALMQGKWPLLTSLVLDSNSLLSPAAIALICTAASWTSLSGLSLAQVQLDSSSLHSIALMHKQLQSLNLASTGSTAVPSQLTTLPWPQLQALVLTGNRLTAEAMAGLIKAEILHLSDLYLGDNDLDAAAAVHLPQSFWPQLRRLSLANNALDDTAMAFLAKGNWPKLETLSLYGNEVSVLRFKLLMAGHWPQLCNLTLDGKMSLQHPGHYSLLLTQCLMAKRGPSILLPPGVLPALLCLKLLSGLSLGQCSLDQAGAPQTQCCHIQCK